MFVVNFNEKVTLGLPVGEVLTLVIAICSGSSAQRRSLSSSARNESPHGRALDPLRFGRCLGALRGTADGSPRSSVRCFRPSRRLHTGQDIFQSDGHERCRMIRPAIRNYQLAIV